MMWLADLALWQRQSAVTVSRRLLWLFRYVSPYIPYYGMVYGMVATMLSNHTFYLPPYDCYGIVLYTLLFLRRVTSANKSTNSEQWSHQRKKNWAV
jgi:hypothetical protein